MFRGFFRFKSIRDELKRRRIYKDVFQTEEELRKKRKYNEEKIDLKNKFKIEEDLIGKKCVGFKIVVDSQKSLNELAPNTIKIIKDFGLNASFFFVTGACGRGEGLLNLLNPYFFIEAKKNKSLEIESIKTLLESVIFPFKKIDYKMVDFLDELSNFDIGSYGHSPYKWVKAIKSRNGDLIKYLYHKSIEDFEEIFKTKCTSFASPYFLCSNDTMLLKDDFYFDYSSDCRGVDPFFPVVDIKVLKTPQVPVTLPTMAEWFFVNGENPASFFAFIKEEIYKQEYPVLEINPLYEFLTYKKETIKFIEEILKEGIKIVSLRDVIGIRVHQKKPLPKCTLSYGLVEGRRRFVTIQMLEV